jgi:dsDNA-binding SOS-regulon protein
VGCWYIECGKTICPVEEEEVKIACDKADSRDAVLVSDQVEVPEEENEVELSLFHEKERNKILLLIEKEAQKAKDKVEKEAQKAKDKEAREAKKGGRASKSKIVAAPSPPVLLTETSTASPS